ncbi:PepSY domain-containing protein [uncultured Parvibaculum sp.]|uniref:PepSY domain-containing protein n=1 Tax=uncultured Parvibaculum sp. TaxID=291828 RepID=UPI0030EC7B2A|tara:strand:+ start:12037 stop:12399 length:363 start_codon:yes stop_codon:yes gene_type:complete
MTRTRTWVALTTAAATLLLMGSGPALADRVIDAEIPAAGLLVEAQYWGRGPGEDDARDAVRQGRAISAGQAKQAALSSYPGRFLDMSLAGQTYYVKIRTPDNRVVVVAVDAASGRVMGAR